MILFLSETKIDASFPDAQFSIDNFTMWRADRNTFGGGVIVYIRSDLAADRNIQYEFREIESIGVEVTSGNEKWFLVESMNLPVCPMNNFTLILARQLIK